MWVQRGRSWHPRYWPSIVVAIPAVTVIVTAPMMPAVWALPAPVGVVLFAVARRRDDIDIGRTVIAPNRVAGALIIVSVAVAVVSSIAVAPVPPVGLLVASRVGIGGV